MIEAPDLATVKDALRIDDDESDDELTRLVAVALEFANNQAPDAPAAVGAEAVIRMVAYLYEGPSGVEMSNAGAWRRSGAEGLLSRWTVRRAGVIA